MTFKTISKLTVTAIAPALLLSFSACSSKMSKSDCEKADYYELGYKDGKKGGSGERLGQLKDTCGSQGVTVNEDNFNYGRKVGLTEYCDAGQAEKDAKKGVTDSICLKEKVPPYEFAYNKAIVEHKDDVAKNLQKIQSEKNELQQKEDKLQAQLNTINQQQGVTAPAIAPAPQAE